MSINSSHFVLAPRGLCASLFALLMVSLALSLLAASNARAGSYIGPVCAGGTCHIRGGAGGSVNNASCSGAISVTFIWQPAAGQTPITDPPPSEVIITETGAANAAANTAGSSPVADVTYSVMAGGTVILLPGKTARTPAAPSPSTSSVP